MTRTIFLFSIWLFVLTWGFAGAVVRPTGITINNNGYSGILVSIDPSVSEDQSLIDDIKKMFTDASAFLYTVTEKRVYFKDVSILVPSSWSRNAAWKPAATELYSNADIIIQNPSPTTRRGHRINGASAATTSEQSRRAFTRTYGGCGQQGVRINVFTDVFSIRNTYGPAGRVLVHEWAHFRWGVFNEFAHEGEPQFYFSPKTGKLEAIRCNINIVGRTYKVDPTTGRGSLCDKINPVTGVYDDGCVFSPYTRGHFNDNVTSSIMDRVEIPSISYFCNDDSRDASRIHNYEAPSHHNRLCSGRSTWSVIMDSHDFKGNANPPRNIPDTTPSFNVVQQGKNRRMVMAIDASNSMQSRGKLDRARQAAASFINDALDDDAEVGVVTFSSQAVMASPVQKLGDPNARQNISQTLPKHSSGITSIGAALLKSMETLKLHDPNASDTFIVLLSDGKDTAKPTVAEVMDQVRDAGAIVNVVALSNEADPNLSQLASATGGRYYYDNNDVISTSALDAIMDISTAFDSGEGKQPVQVLSRADFLRPGHTMKGDYQIDGSLGRNTKMVVTYTDQPPDVIFLSPSKRPYDSVYPEYSLDTELKRIVIFITELSETGHWSYRITNDQKGAQTVSVLVLSRGSDPHVEPLRLAGAVLTKSDKMFRSRIVAEVKRAGAPVNGLKVEAIISQPVGSPLRVELLDSGSGADIIKGDGLYSRYFIKFDTEGHYSVRIEVTGYAWNNDKGTIACVNAGTTYYKVDIKRHWHDVGGSGDLSSKWTDLHPPMRINDLRVLHTDSNIGTVMLAWTAPGDDLDQDKASYYTVLYAKTAQNMFFGNNRRTLSHDSVIEGRLNNPKPFGNKEQITVKILLPSSRNLSLVFAIFAIDKAGNEGELSNLATVGFGFVPDYSDREYLNQQHTNDKDNPKKVPPKQKRVLATVVGVFAGLLFAVVLGSVIVYIVTAVGKRRRVSDEINERKKNHVV